MSLTRKQKVIVSHNGNLFTLVTNTFKLKYSKVISSYHPTNRIANLQTKHLTELKPCFKQGSPLCPSRPPVSIPVAQVVLIEYSVCLTLCT